MFPGKETEEVKSCRYAKSTTLVYVTLAKTHTCKPIPADYTFVPAAPGMKGSPIPLQLPAWRAA